MGDSLERNSGSVWASRRGDIVGRVGDQRRTSRSDFQKHMLSPIPFIWNLLTAHVRIEGQDNMGAGAGIEAGIEFAVAHDPS